MHDSTPIGDIKCHNQDFIVTENIDFILSGEGEHIWLYIEKDGLATSQVIEAVAKYCNISIRDIGYSGLKDKYAITRQWLSIYAARLDEIDWTGFKLEGAKILDIARHNKKLKTGSHKSNHFNITVRNLTRDQAYITTRLEHIAQYGFSNKFGEQRFGSRNIEKAIAFASGKIKIRSQKDKGFLMSVMRSLMFNRYLELRHDLNSTLEIGDIVGFINGNTYFAVDAENYDNILQRMQQRQLTLAGPLAGAEQKLTLAGKPLSLYQQVISEYPQLSAYLETRAGLSYRLASILPNKLTWTFANNTLILDFELPSGAYATTLIEALGDETL